MRIQPRGASAFVDTNGVRLHYLEYGRAGVPVAIVPGITSPAITWEFVAEALAADYHVYVMDVRGRGLSDKPATGYRLPDYAADLDGFIRALDLGRPFVLGHSMGARIAAAFGALYPDPACPLVVVDPPLSGPGRPPYPSPLQYYLDAIRAAKVGKPTLEELRRQFPKWSDEQLQIRADWLPTCDEHAVAETHRAFQEEDFFAYWRKVRAPVLFIYGGASPAVSADGASEVAEANPSAEMVCIPGVGHMIPWENLPGLLAATRAFIDRHAR